MERRRALRVVVSEDHEIFRRELLIAIEAEPQLAVSVEVPSLSELRLDQTAPVSVVVVDLSPPIGDAAAAIAELVAERSEISVIALAGPLDDPLPALLAGVIGVVDKVSAADDIADAIRISAERGAFFSRSAARSLLRVGTDVLSADHQELLQHRAAGRSHAEIAEFLGVDRLELGRRMSGLAGEIRSDRARQALAPRVAMAASVE